MIELLTSTAYSLVEASWHTAAVIVKFYLVYVFGSLYLQDKLEKTSLKETLLEESKIVLPTIVAIGALTLVINYELRPQLELLSELTALIYLGYLFWEF